jgi:hypothetical protein
MSAESTDTTTDTTTESVSPNEASARAAALAELEIFDQDDAPPPARDGRDAKGRFAKSGKETDEEAEAPPAAAEEAAAEEPKPDATKEAEDESKRPGAKAWKAIRREKQRLATQHREIVAAQQRLVEQHREIETIRQKADRLDRILALKDSDPDAFEAEIGYSYEGATSRRLKLRDPSSEEYKAAEQRRLDEEVKRRVDEALAPVRLERAQQAKAAAEEKFLGMVGDEKRFPTLALKLKAYDRDRVMREAYEVADGLAKELRRTPTDEEIATVLERRDAPVIEKLRAAVGGSVSERATEVREAPKPGAKSPPRTLRNEQATERTGNTDRKKTVSELRAEALRELESAF